MATILDEVPTIEMLDFVPQVDEDMVENTHEDTLLEPEHSLDPPFEIQPSYFH